SRARRRWRRRLLLRQTMQCSESPDQIDRMNADYRATRKCFGDTVQRDAILRIIERRYEHSAIGDVEIRVARRQPLSVHHHRSREGNRQGFKRPALRRCLQTAQIIDRARVILVRWILLVREDDRIPTGKARDIVDVAMSIVPRRAFTQPYSIGDAQLLGEGLLVVLSAHAWVSHLDV